MKTSEFDYALPEESIARAPAEPRDAARLLVHEIGADRTRHLHVRDLPDVLRADDLVVLNDTRVRPARLLGRRASGGALELLVLGPAEGGWRALVKPAKRLAPGDTFEIEEVLVGTAVRRESDAQGTPDREWIVSIRDPRAPDKRVEELLEAHGRMPLPPYVLRARGEEVDPRFDRERYQTVFARHAGAVAAPTAGLHFTPELFARLDARGVRRATVTLHVGLGTFQPIQTDEIEAHSIHAEDWTIDAATAELVRETRSRGGRVVAVGTTSLRTLESAARDDGTVRGGSESTRLYVRPGHRFRAVDALLTNFHLPRSSLLVLVAALTGRERMLRLYAEALERGYRFYSYGDAMLLLP